MLFPALPGFPFELPALPGFPFALPALPGFPVELPALPGFPFELPVPERPCAEVFSLKHNKQNLARRLLALRPHLVKFWHLSAFMVFIRKPLRVENTANEAPPISLGPAWLWIFIICICACVPHCRRPKSMKSDLAVSVIAATFPEPITVLTCGQCNVDDIQLQRMCVHA